MQFNDLMTFVNNYEAGENPDVADLNLFFKKDISAVLSDPKVVSIETPSESWVKSGDAAIASDIAEKLISNKGYAIFYYDDAYDANLLWFAGDSFVKIDNLLRFGKLISNTNNRRLWGVATVIETVKDVEDTAEMLDEDLFDYGEDSTWIDDDDDWGYTNWSKLFGRPATDTDDRHYGWGYADPNQMAWLVQIEDFEFAIMNWTKTAINVLLAYINTKV
jgi:hypothetical protein